MTKTKQYADLNLPTIGILGDGQLSMMMVEAYQKLGGSVFIFGESNDGPASSVADKVFVGNPNKFEDLRGFFDAVDIVTLENEFIDSTLLSYTSGQCSTAVFPDPDRYGLIEDKLSEKNFFEALKINLADFFEVKTESDLVDVPGYLKLAKGGYDGIGTYRVNNKVDAIARYREIKSSGTILFEHAIDFKKELSLIGVSGSNETVFYPLVETIQEQGTCRYVVYPSGVSAAIEKKAQNQVLDILTKLDTRGLFAFEFFIDNNDRLILNESAPRPHNSGHITLDLSDCSQFENHMRAVAGMALKKPQLIKSSMTMINLLGTKNGQFNPADITDNINDLNTSVTLYRKKQSRVNRKMGHINLWGENQRHRADSFTRNLEV